MNSPQPALTVAKGQARVSLQDFGRQHNLSLGVSTSGVADEYGMYRANQLVANNANCPILEIMLGGVEIHAQTRCTIAVYGLDIRLEINDKAVNTTQAITLECNDKVAILPFQKGIYGYLAISGGFSAQLWLGSVVEQNVNQSQYFQGSIEPTDPTITSSYIRSNLANSRQFYAEKELTLRFIPNNNYQQLSKELKKSLENLTLTIDHQSNKMGYRLTVTDDNADIAKDITTEITANSAKLSTPVNFGQLQLPSSKQWIVLMKDRQTMGGYPTLGTIMRIDLFRLAQMRPGLQVSLKAVTIEQAQSQLTAFYQKLKLIP
ncbi:5-oxoprolinase subunit C family protein [Colwellia sp. MEBiC06753]